MELRTGNEQLRRVNERIDSLVEDIRTELLARDNLSKGLSDGKIHSLLKYIANPLKHITIDGDEMMLDDMLDLYDLVISELDQIVQSKKYSDDKSLSKSELETFEKARNVLKTDKENGIDVIDQVYTEIIQEHKSGALEKTYIGRKKAEDKDIKEISKKIHKLETEISDTIEPASNLIDKLLPEIALFVYAENAYKKIEKIEEKLTRIENDRVKPDLSEEEKEMLDTAEQALLTKKINIMKDANPELKKDEYKQYEGEPLSDYSIRLKTAFAIQALGDEEILIQKIANSYGDKINIAEFNKVTNSYTIKEVNFKDRYFPKLADGNRPTEEELRTFAQKLNADYEELKIAMDAKIDEKTDLEAEKREKEEILETQIKTSTLSVVPYVEKENGENLSEFAKWRQRMAFRFKNPEVMFMGRKEVEDAMCKDKIKKATIELDRKRLLKDVEAKQNKFKDKYVVKTKARSNVYNQWDKNRIPNSRDDGSR